MDLENLSTILSLSKKELRLILERDKLMPEYLEFRKTNGSKYSVMYKEFMIKKYVTVYQKQWLVNKYEAGYGLKTIAKELRISYTLIRQLFKYLCIPIRSGYNIVTRALCETRKIKATFEKQNKSGWFSEAVRNQIKIKNKTNKGVQGWYFNKSMNKWVWLRSTYEYIYAKWLDRTQQLWDTEVKTYILKNGSEYRPDFFIYENGVLSKIIEVKGFFDPLSYKANMLGDEVSEEVILLNFTNSSILPYCLSGMTYITELKEWKNTRKQNENKKNLSTSQ